MNYETSVVIKKAYDLIEEVELQNKDLKDRIETAKKALEIFKHRSNYTSASNRYQTIIYILNTNRYDKRIYGNSTFTGTTRT